MRLEYIYPGEIQLQIQELEETLATYLEYTLKKYDVTSWGELSAHCKEVGEIYKIRGTISKIKDTAIPRIVLIQEGYENK